MSALIAALDGGLAQNGEDVILRRTVGVAPNQIPIDVVCRVRIDSITDKQLAAGIPSTELNVIMSPTQINNAQWPGGGIPALPPFNLDQRIPRAGPTDKILRKIIGSSPQAVTFCDPKIINNELVRINMRIAG